MKRSLYLLVLTGMLLASCGTFTVTIESTPAGSAGNPAPLTAQPQPTQPPAEPALIPTATASEPTAAPVLLVETPQIPTQVPPAVEPTPANQMVKIYLIAIDDNGKSGDLVGCGDSAVPVQVEVPATQGVLKAAMQALLAIKDRQYGESGLYNALYQSNLQVDRVTIESGKATVELSGTMMLGGVCDIPRVEAQLTKTALQFSTVSEVTITVNGKLLKDALSLK